MMEKNQQDEVELTEAYTANDLLEQVPKQRNISDPTYPDTKEILLVGFCRVC